MMESERLNDDETLENEQDCNEPINVGHIWTKATEGKTRDCRDCFNNLRRSRLKSRCARTTRFCSSCYGNPYLCANCFSRHCKHPIETAPQTGDHRASWVTRTTADDGKKQRNYCRDCITKLRASGLKSPELYNLAFKTTIFCSSCLTKPFLCRRCFDLHCKGPVEAASSEGPHVFVVQTSNKGVKRKPECRDCSSKWRSLGFASDEARRRSSYMAGFCSICPTKPSLCFSCFSTAHSKGPVEKSGRQHVLTVTNELRRNGYQKRRLACRDCVEKRRTGSLAVGAQAQTTSRYCSTCVTKPFLCDACFADHCKGLVESIKHVVTKATKTYADGSVKTVRCRDCLIKWRALLGRCCESTFLSRMSRYYCSTCPAKPFLCPTCLDLHKKGPIELDDNNILTTTPLRQEENRRSKRGNVCLDCVIKWRAVFGTGDVFRKKASYSSLSCSTCQSKLHPCYLCLELHRKGLIATD